jgi:integration host factor subunit alpha
MRGSSGREKKIDRAAPLGSMQEDKRSHEPDRVLEEDRELNMAGRTITRADLCEAVYQKLGLSRAESSELVETVLKEISDTLVSGETVKLSSFGSFVVREKGERIGRNPKTGVEVPITPRRVLVFKPSNVMKARINGDEDPAED